MSVKTSERSPRAISMPRQSPELRGINSAWVRRVNAVLLMQALRRHPGSSQRELAVLTGLDKATVSAVTAQLVEAGLVARKSAESTTRRLGRPAVALEIPQSAGVVLGVSMEPHRIEVVAADLAGRIVDREAHRGSAEPHGAMTSLAVAIAALKERLGPLPQRAIGIGVPALIDASGLLLFGPNLGWRDVRLAEIAAELLPAPVLIDNDSNAAAIAERAFGSCAGIDDFIYLSGNSGIGGAIFAGGALYRGADGTAGEFGHTRVVSEGRACACGGHGCLETYASIPALLAALSERGCFLGDVAEVAMHAEAGDSTVLAVLAETGELVGRALSASINALGPSHLVIGGTLAIVAPWMLPSLRKTLARAAMEQVAARLDILLSPLGADAVMMGGVALALQKVDHDLIELGSG